MITRFKSILLGVVLLVAICGILASNAFAENYPNKPITIIVPMAPGGAIDIMARLLGQKLSENLGQPVLVDNRGGAGGSIGPAVVAKAPPDGYTVLLMSISSLLSSVLLSDLSFDIIKDFEPVTQLNTSPMILIGGMSQTVKSVKELIALAKSKPGKLNYGSDGVGSIAHLGMELFKSMTGTDMVHIPYKGQAPSMVDMLAGRLDVRFSGTTASLPYVSSGKVRGLGTGSPTIDPLTPELIPVAKDVPGFECLSWLGVLVPAGTPKEIVMKLNTEIVKILNLPEITKRLAANGQTVSGNTPEEFANILKRDKAKWGKVIKDVGIRKQ